MLMMKSRTAAIVAAGVLVVGVIVWFVVGRGDPSLARPKLAGVTAPTPASRAPTGKANEPRRDGPPPILARDADPDGPLLLEGLVLDDHEQPVAGAEVWISSTPQRVVKAETDGTFSFDKLLGRTYAVGARAGELVGGPVQTKLTVGSEPLVIRLRPGAQLAITVRDAVGDAPIANATVTLADATEPTATTDAEGHATFTGVGDGWTTVAATAAGYGPVSASLTIGKTQLTAELTIALNRGAAVSGVVVDEAGAPIAGAKVSSADVAIVTWNPGGTDRNAITSDGKGEFTIPALAAGTYRLSAADETHAPAASELVTVDGEHVTTGVRIVMPAGGRIAGVVVGTDGQPVPYATVKLSGAEWATDMVYRQAAADDRGTFAVTALPRRPLKVRAESETASSEPAAVDLVGASARTDLRLVLDQDGAISGVVVDGAGQPVPEASVSGVPDFLAEDRRGNDFILAASTATTTDGGGRFTLRGLDAGTYRLAASREGHGERTAWNAQAESVKAGATDVRLVLPSPGGVRGTIVGDSGKAPALALVAAGGEYRASTRDGAFELGGMTPGKYDVRVTGADFGEAVRGDVVVVEGKVTDLGAIKVTAGRQASGRLVDAKGAPVEGATVMVGKMIIGDGKTSAGGDDDNRRGLRTATTGAQGGFTVRGIPRGGAIIVAEHATRGRSVSVDLPAGTEDVTGLELTLRGYGSLTGTVTRKGAPVAGAAVSAAPLGASGQAVFVTTGADGKFVLDKVPAGPTTVQAMKQVLMSSFSSSKTVTVALGTATDASIDIPAGELELDVTITTKPGETVNMAFMLLVRGAFVAHDGKALMDGFLAAKGASEGTAGTGLYLGGPTPVAFTELVAGAYTVCALPLTGNMMDQQMSARINDNLEKLEAVCKPILVKDAPPKQDLTMLLPQMRPLPAPGEPVATP